MHVDITELFIEMLPLMIAGAGWVIFAAFFLGGRERRRLGVVQLDHDEGMSHFTAFKLTDWRFLFNAVLTIALISMMMLSLMPLPILFMLAFGLGVLVNFPSVKDQKEVIGKYADNVMAVTLLILPLASSSGSCPALG